MSSVKQNLVNWQSSFKRPNSQMSYSWDRKQRKFSVCRRNLLFKMGIMRNRVSICRWKWIIFNKKKIDYRKSLTLWNKFCSKHNLKHRMASKEWVSSRKMQVNNLHRLKNYKNRWVQLKNKFLGLDTSTCVAAEWMIQASLQSAISKMILCGSQVWYSWWNQRLGNASI